MNHQERLELLEALVRAGVTHYKAHDLEINRAHRAQDLVAPLPGSGVQSPSQAPTKEEAEKLKSLAATVRKSDIDLLDELFPAGAGG